MDTIAGKYKMTTCKQLKRQENLTPLPPSLVGKGGQDWSLDQNVIPVPSPLRGGLGRGYLYLLQKSITTNSSGFTIIECLLAIILVGILMTAIAPVMVLSVATRVQARRVEQATQAARSYIDAVQSGTALKPENTVPLSETVGTTTKTYTSDRGRFATVAAPTPRTINCPDNRATAGTSSIYPYCGINSSNRPNQPSLYCVDNDGGGCTPGSSKDYIVQAFRSVKATAPGVRDTTDNGDGGYILGVRVYRADAFDGAATLQTTNVSNGKKVATYTGGKGNQFAPLVEMTTEILPKGSDGAAMKSLCARLGGCK